MDKLLNLKLPMNPRVLITGGRDHNNPKIVHDALNYVLSLDFLGEMTIIVGDALGVDSFAVQWATEHQVNLILCKADWDKYKKSAGAIRNTQMLKLKPDICLAFKGYIGTENMVNQCQGKVKVIKIE